jgi:probable metal-binding protein
MRLMLELDCDFNRESLARAIIDRFGVDARFHSCSQAEMGVQAVIDFLESRGKFVARAEGFNTADDKICSH